MDLWVLYVLIRVISVFVVVIRFFRVLQMKIIFEFSLLISQSLVGFVYHPRDNESSTGKAEWCLIVCFCLDDAFWPFL